MAESNITCDDGLFARGFLMLPVLVAQEDRLSVGAKFLFQVLYYYLWRGDDYPGHEQVAIDFGGSEKSVRNWLQELVDLGLLERFRPGQGKPNYYVLKNPSVLLEISER